MGKPRMGRQCQPELKTCTTAIFFTSNDGTAMLVKATEDMNGKHLFHEICSFNDFKDVRTCVDWESGSTHRDMQDSSGEWHKVADE
jgi:hypothetical protein